MIDTIDNGIQLVLTALCMVIAARRAFLTGNRAWVLLALFSGSFFLADLYWMLVLFFIKETPHYFYISDLNWYSSFLFLLLLILFINDRTTTREVFLRDAQGNTPDKISHPGLLLAAVSAFTLGMCVFYSAMYGDYFGNAVAAVLMLGIIWHSLYGILYLGRHGEPDDGRKPVYILTLVFCALEYGLWTSSCFMTGVFYWVYYVFDALLSVSIFLFAVVLRKAVDR